MSIEERLRTFILGELRPKVAPEEMTYDYPLLKNYVIESMGVFLLVSFMEEGLGIDVLDEDIVPEHFETIDAMARYVRSRLRPEPSLEASEASE